jgi:hypothetical protein
MWNWSCTPQPPPSSQLISDLDLNEIKKQKQMNNILERMSNLGLSKYRIDDIELHLYVQSATLDVTQQRLC